MLPGKEGLLHISQIANERVNQVSDYLKEGQAVKVKVLEADDKGRLRLPGDEQPEYQGDEDHPAEGDDVGRVQGRSSGWCRGE